MFKSIFFICIFLGIVGFQNTEEPVVGAIAPDFSMVSLTGENINLSTLKGSIVFVDFWASWCLPCRKQNLLLEKIHDKYRKLARRYDMKIYFISISLDTNKELWKVAVLKDNLDPKKQLCDFGGWESAITKSYHIKKLPSSFLIDTKGKIIAKDIWGETLTDTLDKLFNQLSN